MKLKNEQQAILTRRILIALSISLALVVIFQIILYMNQADNQISLQLTIESQQSQVAALIPTETFTPSRTPLPTSTRIPTRTSTPRPTSTLTSTPTITLTPTLTPTPASAYYLYQISYPTILLSLDWQSSGNYIAFGNFDTGNIIVYDVINREEIRQLEGLTIGISDIRWSPDAQFLAAADLDGNIFVWNTETWEVIHNFSNSDAIVSIKWSQDGRYLASLDINDVILWETTSWTLALSTDSSSFSSPADEIALAPDASGLVYMPYLETSLNMATFDEDFSILERETIFELERSERFLAVAWSFDGTLLVSGTENGAIHIFDTADNTLLKSFTDHTDMITDLRWSNDNRYLASAAADETVIIWDVQSWEKVSTLNFNLSLSIEEVDSIAWSPDNCYIAAQTHDIEIWALPELCEQE